MVYCDKVIIGEDKTATLVRVYDTIGIPPGNSPKIGDMIEMRDSTLFVSIKKGNASGKNDLFAVCIDPSLTETPLGLLPYTAVGTAESGANGILPVRIRWAGEGIYWTELRTADGRVVARTPAKIMIGDATKLHEELAKKQSK
jgi:hypothetical protein